MIRTTIMKIPPIITFMMTSTMNILPVEMMKIMRKKNPPLEVTMTTLLKMRSTQSTIVLLTSLLMIMTTIMISLLITITPVTIATTMMILTITTIPDSYNAQIQNRKIAAFIENDGHGRDVV